MVKTEAIKDKRGHYTPEFKARAVAMVLEENKTRIEASRALGIPDRVLNKWVAIAAKKKSGRKNVPRTVASAYVVAPKPTETLTVTLPGFKALARKRLEALEKEATLLRAWLEMAG